MSCHRCGAAEAPWPVIGETGRHYYCTDCTDALNVQRCCDCQKGFTTLELCERCEEPLCDDCQAEHLREHDYAEACAEPLTNREFFDMIGGGRF